MKRALVTGSDGQLATEYQLSNPLDEWDYVFYNRRELDITNLEAVEKVFQEDHFDAVVNLAAYTNVEKAEKEETEKCYNANALGPKNLAIVCNLYNIPLIHISTDYVFDGRKQKAYVETDIENPLNHYGRTKFLGEKWIQETHDWYYIIRTSWVYSNYAKNFMVTMLGLSQERPEVNVVEDQWGSPTSTKELCRAIDAVLSKTDKSLSGVYHFSGLGRTSWKDFASEIFEQAKITIFVNGVSSSKWPSKVERPCDTYMSSEKFSKAFSCTPLHWKNALKEVLKERRIIPVKVGDTVIVKDEKHVIVSTDWLKRVARIAKPENIENSQEVPFEILMIK